MTASADSPSSASARRRIAIDADVAAVDAERGCDQPRMTTCTEGTVDDRGARHGRDQLDDLVGHHWHVRRVNRRAAGDVGGRGHGCCFNVHT
jgi:hypothetical protein